MQLVTELDVQTYAKNNMHFCYEYNYKLRALQVEAHTGNLPAEHAYVTVKPGNVVLTALKKAEDDNGIVVRMYEAYGGRGRCVFATDFPLRRVVETNLMEKEERALAFRDGRVAIDFKPFQIVTIKLLP